MPSLPWSSPPDPTSALASWRTAHPHATLAEIEHAVDQQLSAYRATLITDLATATVPDRPPCPSCGAVLHQVGRRSRTVRTAQEGTLTFTEATYRCPACGAGFSPPD